jgi:hypothetical protein
MLAYIFGAPLHMDAKSPRVLITPSYSDFGEESEIGRAWLHRRTKVEPFEEIRRECEHGAGTIKGVAKAQYCAIVLGVTRNVGGRVVLLLIKNPLCKRVVVVTRRKTDAFADTEAFSEQ